MMLPALILIVGDETSLQQQLGQALEKQGYQVTAISSGTFCLETSFDLMPDLVLVDAATPVQDKILCHQSLQSVPQWQSTPILMMLNEENPELIAGVFECGAADYVTKPLNWIVLQQRVHRLITQSQLYRQLEATRQELEHLICWDRLTLVANQRHFEETLEREWRRLEREPASLSLIWCEIDYFQNYVGNWGEAAGDECLKQVVAAMKRVVKRPADLIGRCGGGKLGIILPQTKALGANHVAASIGVEIKKLKLPHPDSPVSQYVTVSLGIASLLPSPFHQVAVLRDAAEKALDQAKAEGCDRVVFVER